MSYRGGGGGGGYGGGRGGGGGYGGRGGGRGGGASGRDVAMAEPRAPFVQLVAMPRNGQYGSSGRETKVETNVYPAEVKSNEVYHYDVEIKLDRVPKKLDLKIAMWIMRQVEDMKKDELGGQVLAYDGKKNVYAREKLGRDNIRCMVQYGSGRRPKNYSVSLSFVGVVEMSRLHGYLEKGGEEWPAETLGALGVVMRTRVGFNFVPCGRSFAFAPDKEQVHQNVHMGLGVEAWRSFYQALKPIEAGLALNFDVSFSPFYKQQNMIDFACDILHLDASKDPFANNQGLDLPQISMIERELRGLKIVQVHLPASARVEKPVKAVTRRAANDMKFFFQKEGQQGREVSIAEYFETEHGAKLKYPHLPCIDITTSKKGKPINVPMEFCEMAPGQRRTKGLLDHMKLKMLELSSGPPKDRQADAKLALKKADFSNDPYLQAFGIKVNESAMTVKARVIDAPMIYYRRNSFTPEAPDRMWNWEGKYFITPNELNNWGILVLDPNVDLGQAKQFRDQIIEALALYGVGIRKNPMIHVRGRDRFVKDDLTTLKSSVDTEHGECELIVIIKENLSSRDYNEIKLVGDTHLQVPTQCIVGKHIRPRAKAQYLANIGLKINLKLKGLNTKIDVTELPKKLWADTDYMFIGADVSHASAVDMKTETPSIAAVVGTCDRMGHQYHGSYRIQNAKLPCIGEMGEMVALLVKEYQLRLGDLPKKLFIFRDGASDGQFPHIISTEINGIRSKCAELTQGYAPQIVFVVVQKRHRMRFFPVDQKDSDSSGNCCPGLVIDSEVTHPYSQDFYLMGHRGLQGTSRPCKYTILCK